jgi:diacylglycerol diphosphate phosphatase/phosphatidate phosphatase
MFALDDRRIQYPHADNEHVPVGMQLAPLLIVSLPRTHPLCFTVWLLIYAGLFPFVILLVWSFAFFKPHKTHVTLLGFGITLLITLFVTDVSNMPFFASSLVAQNKPRSSKTL